MLLPLTFALLLAQAAPPLFLEPGTWWEYRESYTERLGGLDRISDDTTRFEVHGRAGRLFLDQKGGFDPAPAPIELAPSSLRLGGFTGDEPLPLPLALGRRGPILEAGLSAWVVEAEEQVNVPAGSFAALRCVLRADSVIGALWIAPAVGVVRETQGVRGRRPDLERVLLRWGTAGRTR